jgi:hypothetical protein
VPDDLGGQPFPDGEQPDEEHHGAADEEFAAVVLDEEFVRCAEVHEPTADERMLAAAQPHTETEVPLRHDDGYVYGPAAEGDLPPGFDPEGQGTTHGYGLGYEARRGGAHPYHEDYADEDLAEEDHDLDDEAYGRALGPRPYRGHVRWQRPVAWVLAVVMGVGVVALAFAAVYRGAAGHRDEPAPPPPSGVGVPLEDGAPAPGPGPDSGPGRDGVEPDG